MFFFENFVDILTKKYCCFEGRAGRAEFWYWVLARFIIGIVSGILDGIIGIGIFRLIFGLALLLPWLGVAVRRLHDTNRSGWWFLLGLIPLVGIIILIVFWAQKGQQGENQYGPEPDGVGNC